MPFQTIAKETYIVDAHYLRDGMTCCAIVTDGGEAAIIDAGTAGTVQAMLETLKTLGVQPDNVRHCIVTHAHLDHCAALAPMLKHFPNATAHAHEAAAEHVLNPFTRLWDSAVALFGQKLCEKHYLCAGRIDKHRLQTVGKEASVTVGKRKLKMIYTPGHAWHHISVFDAQTRTMFAGDSFGVSYREMDVNGSPLMLPTTPPPQYKPEVLKASVRKMLDYDPERICLTHYGVISHPEAAARQLFANMDQSLEIAKDICTKDDGDNEKALEQALLNWYVSLASKADCSLSGEEVCSMLTFDAALNSKGILHLLQREKTKAQNT